MIIISKGIVKATAFIKEYKSSRIEREIISKMDLGKEVYEYNSVDQLYFELKMRKAIVHSAIKLNKSHLAFKTFNESKCNETYWKHTEEGGFILKKRIMASEAIRDISLNSYKYGTECSTAMIIIYYQALLDVFTEELFNELFPKIHLMNWHYIDDILEEAGFLIKRKDYLPGDRRYFANPDVKPTKPEWQGENVIDLGKGMYFGHGIGIGDSDEIIYALNKYRVEGARRIAYLVDSAAVLDFKKLANIAN